MDKKLSRTPQINVEKCVSNVGGQRFNLVLIAAQKLREMRSQHYRQDKSTPVPTINDALIEIQSGNVDPIEYIAKVGEKKKQRR